MKFNLKEILKRRTKKSTYCKLFLYVVIVNAGLGDQVIELLQDWDSNVQCTFLGKGTASKEVLHVIGIDDERKDVILAFVNETKVEQVRKQLDKNFFTVKEHVGIGFSIALTSVVGKKVYHFLTNTI